MSQSYKIHVVGPSKGLETILKILGEVSKEGTTYNLSTKTELTTKQITEITFMPQVVSVLDRNIRFIK